MRRRLQKRGPHPSLPFCTSDAACMLPECIERDWGAYEGSEALSRPRSALPPPPPHCRRLPLPLAHRSSGISTLNTRQMEAAQEAAAAAGPGGGGDAQQAAAAAAKEAAAAAPAAGFSKRKNRGNLRKRAADSDGEGGGEGGGGVVRKAPKQKDAPLGFTTKRADRTEVFAFESSKTLQQRANDATRTNEQETAHDRDAR